MADEGDFANLVSNAEPPAEQETSLSGPDVTTSSTASHEHVNTSFVGDKDEQNNEPSEYEVTTVPIPVVYAGIHGAVFIHAEKRVIRKADGTTVIETPETPMGDSERPIEKKDLRFLKIFSIISIVLFLPTGLAALVYALMTDRAFHDGLQRGDLTLAQKYSKRCERLLILSLVCGLLMYCIIIAVVEKTTLGHDDNGRLRGTFGHNTP